MNNNLTATERQLATVRIIEEVKPINGADLITAYRVGGWYVVDQVNKYTVGDVVIYVEPDAWVPHELAPFLSKGKEPREYLGVKGEKLRTIKLKKQISQGLLLPISCLQGKVDNVYIAVGLCVDANLNIVKYEPPIPANLAGIVKGNFPSFFPKTNQPRVQNLNADDISGIFEQTEKLEGTSFSAYIYNGDFGVCSRNLDLKEDEATVYWQVARQNNIKEKMLSVTRLKNFAIQGEIVGENIQGNIYNLKGLHLYIFDIYDIDSGNYLPSHERLSLIEEMNLNSAPVLDYVDLTNVDILQIVDMATGYSVLNQKALREGVVFKHTTNPYMTFKSISAEYLLKH